MRTIRNKKINSKKIAGLAALVLTSTMLTSCIPVSNRREYEYNRIECTSDGFYSESRQFRSYDPSTNKNIPNSFIYYDKWTKTEDGKYSREVKEYNASKIKYEDISDLGIDLEKSIENVLGEPNKVYEQISDYVGEEELNRDAHYEATFYSVNYDKYVTIREKDRGQFIAVVAGMITAVVGMGALIAWRKKQDNEDNTQNKKLVLEKREE